MTANDVEVPETWKRLPGEPFHGPVMIVGATDTGKSTLAQWLIDNLKENGRTVAHLDGDPGQGGLGPPTTMTLRRSDGRTVRWFVGSTSPRGHMLPLVTGLRRLADAVQHAHATVVDTTGMIDPAAGGLYLKQSIFDLLRPATVLALQRDDELEGLLEPLRRRTGLDLYELTVPPDVQRKNRDERGQNRRRQFKALFFQRPHALASRVQVLRPAGLRFYL